MLAVQLLAVFEGVRRGRLYALDLLGSGAVQFRQPLLDLSERHAVVAH